MKEEKEYSFHNVWTERKVSPWSVAFFGYFIILLLQTLFDEKQWTGNIIFVQELMIFAFVICVGMFVVLAICKNERAEREHLMTWLIMVIGIIMRVGYMLYTPWEVRGHDAGILSAGPEGKGHCGYIMRIFEGNLPESNVGQFYHPPLYHFLAAISMHISGLLRGTQDGVALIESAKVVSCVASIGVIYQVKKILEDTDINGVARNVTMLIVAVLPNYYLMAGRINNDSLVFFFIVVILRYTMKWYRNQSYANTIILAVAFGLGIMTKVSCGVMSMFTGVVMLVVFVKNIKARKWKALLKRLLIFGCISGVLGLWYPIRNLVLFQQPFNYVYEIPIDNPVYCGDASLNERMSVLYDFTEKRAVYNDPKADYNLPSYFLRCSLFGEFSFNNLDEVAVGFYWINVIMVILSLGAMVYSLYKRKKNRKFVLGLAMVWGLQVVSFISFNIRYPYACTMDYRYIPITTIIGAIYIGMLYQEIEEKEGISMKLLCKFIQGLVLVFAAFSITFYTHIS